MNKIPAHLKQRINILAHLEGQMHATKRREQMLAELQALIEQDTAHIEILAVVTRWEHGGNPI